MSIPGHVVRGFFIVYTLTALVMRVAGTRVTDKLGQRRAAIAGAAGYGFVMDVVFAFADRIIVLARGRLIADGNAAAIRDNPQVREVYFGTGKTFAGATP